METTVKQRLIEFIKFLGLSQRRFEESVGFSNGYVNNISKSIGAAKLQQIRDVYPNLNDSWLIDGRGNMLLYSEDAGVGMVAEKDPVAKTLHTTTDAEFSRAPIVPASVAKEPGLDSFEYVQDNIGEVELSNVVVKDMTIYMWHKINDLSMAPRYIEGDLVGLQLCTEGCTIIPGNVYGIDTKSNGMIVRKLYPAEEGYIAKALNNEEYPEFFIRQDDIIRIYRKMIQVRL
jgi:hypothetical protein